MLKASLSVLTLLFLFSLGMPLYAQSETVQCGDIIEGEFTAPAQRLDYRIELAPGDSLSVNGEGIGTSLAFMLALANPAGEAVVTSLTESGHSRPELAPSLFSDIVSARGSYTLIAYNARVYESSGSLNFQDGWNDIGSVGVFILNIGCTLRDGTVIEPGENISESRDNTTEGSSSEPEFTGYGFAGLPAVDFSSIAQIPLVIGSPMSGAITPTGSEIFGFTFDGSENQRVTLDFTRISGNVNLGLALLYGDNTIVYQASLITSESMSTNLTLPFSGGYTIGVFRIDLLPPATPQASAFQVQVIQN
jgi:hypothetical protein